jgi:hypothetical protein
MSDEVCPLHGSPGNDEKSAIERMLKARSIAVVGLSDYPGRPSYDVAEYLREQGYRIMPVNPHVEEVFGIPAAASLAELSFPPELVLVFRRSEFCGEIAREAVKVGAGGLWLQAGIHSEEARAVAMAAGMDYVEGRCMKVEHLRSRQR